MLKVLRNYCTKGSTRERVRRPVEDEDELLAEAVLEISIIKPPGCRCYGPAAVHRTAGCDTMRGEDEPSRSPGFWFSGSAIALSPFRGLETSTDEFLKTILQGRHRPEQVSTGRSPYHSLAPNPMASGAFTQLCSQGNIVAPRN